MNKIITLSAEKAERDSEAILKKPQKAEPRKNVFKEFFITVSNFFLFTVRFFAEAFKFPIEFNELMRQSFIIGTIMFLVGITDFY